MSAPDATCWTLIRDAAGGDATARDRFARVYLPVEWHLQLRKP